MSNLVTIKDLEDELAVLISERAHNISLMEANYKRGDDFDPERHERLDKDITEQTVQIEELQARLDLAKRTREASLPTPEQVLAVHEARTNGVGRLALPPSGSQSGVVVPSGTELRAALGRGDATGEDAFMEYLRTGKPVDLRAGQFEGTGSLGGYLVPESVSRQLIDMARAKSAFLGAGVPTVVFNEGASHVWPTVEDTNTNDANRWVVEGETVSEATVTFGYKRVEWCTWAVMVKISRHLLRDAKDINGIVTDQITKDLALELDRVIGFGDGQDGEPLGITNWPGVTSTGVSGVPDWSDLRAARLRLAADNYDLRNLVLNAVDEDTLENTPRLIKNVNGTDNVGGSFEVPGSVATAWNNRRITNQMPAGTAVMGDFSEVLFGIRNRLEVTQLNELYAATQQIGLMFWMRCAVFVRRPQAIEVLTGMTTS